MPEHLPPKNHYRLKRQVENPVQPTEINDDGNDNLTDVEVGGKHHWINCDWLKTPKLSCYNCYTRLICNPSGGKLKSCGRYCNNGLCSDIPSDSCRNE